MTNNIIVNISKPSILDGVPENTPIRLYVDSVPVDGVWRFYYSGGVDKWSVTRRYGEWFSEMPPLGIEMTWCLHE